MYNMPAYHISLTPTHTNATLKRNFARMIFKANSTPGDNHHHRHHHHWKFPCWFDTSKGFKKRALFVPKKDPKNREKGRALKSQTNRKLLITSYHHDHHHCHHYCSIVMIILFLPILLPWSFALWESIKRPKSRSHHPPFPIMLWL